MRSRSSLLAILSILLANICLLSPFARAAAADWSLKDLDGKMIHMADFKGKIVVLNFWATWCPPCRAEIPDFINLQKEYEGKGVIIIGLSLDSAAPSEVVAFAKKAGINYPIVMSTDEIAQQYGVKEGIPVTTIVGPDGAIVDSHLGKVEKGYLEAQVKKLLPADH